MARNRPAAKWVRLGPILLLALAALGVKAHRADVNVTARVVRHAAAQVRAAPVIEARAAVRGPHEADPTLLAVQSNGPTRRIERSMRATDVNGQVLRRRVITILTP